MAKVNWETATPEQAQKMRDLIGENQAWAKANLGKDIERDPRAKKDKGGR